ncbi:hypothetical protein D1872_301140 [compost metagenome]
MHLGLKKEDVMFSHPTIDVVPEMRDVADGRKISGGTKCSPLKPDFFSISSHSSEIRL